MIKKNERQRQLSFYFILPVALLLFLTTAFSLLASQADLEERKRTIQGIEIYNSASNQKEYYYLPPSIRLSMDTEGEPSFMLIKYNLAQDVGYSVADAEGGRVTAKQGGVLALEATYKLQEEKRLKIEKELKQTVPGATLALMPLDSASITLKYIDPDSDEIKVTIGPEMAPLDGSVVSWVVPLSKTATDILWDTFSKPASTAILSADVVFEYTGYVAPLKVKVTGNWNNVYNHSSWNANYNHGGFFFRGRADYQSVYDKMQLDGTLKVEWLGEAAPDVQKLVDRLTDVLIKNIFDTSDFKVEDPAQAKKVGGWWGGVSFSGKRVERRREGKFFFDFSRKDKVKRRDSRRSQFTDISKIAEDESVRKRHFRLVDSGDWGVVAPRFFIEADMEKYSKIVVNCRYGNDQPAPAIFSSRTEGLNMVPREWNVDRSRPKEKQYEYEYQIEALLKDGAAPDSVIPVKIYKTSWVKSDKPFLLLNGTAWQGPKKAQLDVSLFESFDEKGIKRALLKVKWNAKGSDGGSKSFKFKTGDEEYQWAPFLLFDGVPSYTAELTYWSKKPDGGSKKMGPFKIKMGEPGASGTELLIDEFPE